MLIFKLDQLKGISSNKIKHKLANHTQCDNAQEN